MSRQTDATGKNVLKYLMEQTIVCIMTISAQSGKKKKSNTTLIQTVQE